MKIGLYIIGDEILSGRRRDRHLQAVSSLLQQRGLILDWVKILSDDLDLLTTEFSKSLDNNSIAFSCGGIGGTPDDLTRLAVGTALDLPLERHPEAISLIESLAQKRNIEISNAHWKMIEFPRNATLIPNPVNGVPGFSVNNHHFVPGFPDMAHPMIEWVLNQYYADLSQNDYAEESLVIKGIPESQFIDIMSEVQQSLSVKAFSLPRLTDEGFQVELGAKGRKAAVRDAMERFQNYIKEISSTS
ncbi:MAG: competence/damage-inducible protein A [bacterium]